MQNDLLNQIKTVLQSCDDPTKLTALFDADGTLWKPDCAYEFLTYIDENKTVKDQFLQANKWDSLKDSSYLAHYNAMRFGDGKNEGLAWAAKIFRGMNTEQATSLCENFARSWPQSDIIPLTRSIVELLRQNHVDVTVVSASPRLLVRAMINSYYDISCSLGEVDVFGIDCLINGGVYTDILNTPVTSGKGKVEVLPAKKKDNCFLAAGNTMSDWQLMEAASDYAIGIATAPEGHPLFSAEKALESEMAKLQPCPVSSEKAKKWLYLKI